MLQPAVPTNETGAGVRRPSISGVIALLQRPALPREAVRRAAVARAREVPADELLREPPRELDPPRPLVPMLRDEPLREPVEPLRDDAPLREPVEPPRDEALLPERDPPRDACAPRPDEREALP